MKYIEKYLNFNNEISFDIIDYNYNDIILERNFRDPLSFYDQTINGRIVNKPLTSNQINRLKTIKKLIDIRLYDINDFEAII